MSNSKLPQTYGQMVQDGQKSKTNRMYRAESSEFVDGQITELVTLAAEELAQIAEATERVQLSDTETVQRRTILYIRSCADTSTIPTFSGLARSMGLSVEALNLHVRTHPDSATAEWLRITHDQFADTLATAAMRNLTNSIVSIFSLKARSGWKETLTIEPAISNPLGEQKSSDRLAEYLDVIEDCGVEAEP